MDGFQAVLETLKSYRGRHDDNLLRDIEVQQRRVVRLYADAVDAGRLDQCVPVSADPRLALQTWRALALALEADHKQQVRIADLETITIPLLDGGAIEVTDGERAQAWLDHAISVAESIIREAATSAALSDPRNWVTWAWIRKNVSVKTKTIQSTNHREKCIAVDKREGQEAKLFLPHIEARFGRCVKQN